MIVGRKSLNYYIIIYYIKVSALCKQIENVFAIIITAASTLTTPRCNQEMCQTRVGPYSKKKLHGIVLRSGQFWRARSQLQEKYVVSSSTLLQQTIWFGLTPILISWIFVLIVFLLPNVMGTSHIILIFILTPLRWFCRPPFSYVFVIAISSSELWSSIFFIIFSCVSSYESLN